MSFAIYLINNEDQIAYDAAVANNTNDIQSSLTDD